MTARTPGNEFWDWESYEVIRELLNDKVIRHAKIGSGEAPLGKCQINAVHTKRDLILQLCQVSMFQAGAIADDERTFPFVYFFQFRKTPDALTSPGMEISSRQFRDSADTIIGVPCEVPEGHRN